ncbi:MAG: OprO/OprP family phosphate-selective porin [Muribaculaceae bacterium]|nr:OprO/OprP family phosphate-selective porin [Muribaculaceae bacterium]
MRKSLAILLYIMTALSVDAQEKSQYIPDVHGAIRAKYEYEPDIDKGRFEIRNARIALEGMIIPVIRYKAEIDLSDEGNIKMLDAYIRYQPNKAWKFTFGQMRVPFSIDAHRSPHLQYFANRSFIAKQVGNTRDVGAAVGWTFGKAVPVTLEGGIFNGSGLTGQKDYWTSNYNFSFKSQAKFRDKFNITLSMQKANAGDVSTYLYDVGAYFQNSRWHIEAEYLRKYYAHNSFKPVNAIDAFAAYRLPLKKHLTAISFLGRYDYMSDHSKGKVHDDGKLGADDPERHRLTGGVTLSLGKKSLQADIRVNYEQYFYARGVTPSISEQSKAVVEFVVHF